MKRMLFVLCVVAAVAGPAVAVSGAQSDRTIVQVAGSDPRFSTLVSLVKQAGLAETLSTGSYTVFAPTNKAFANVPKATLDALAKDPDQLKAVLTYHVAKGRLTAAKVVKRTRITTVNGAAIRVNVRRGRVVLNGSTLVTKTDIGAKNGVIHVIDHVLLPPSN
jgi:uncharacterized surface protein with fasciclin (FAS1) repeats